MTVKTQIRKFEDGRTEVMRLLAADAMDEWVKDDPLSYEKSILWLEDIGPFPYVRVGWARGARSRRGPLHANGLGRVVGYAKLTPDAPVDLATHGYTRRFFYVKDSDPRDPRPDSAVDPRAVLPGTTTS